MFVLILKLIIMFTLVIPAVHYAVWKFVFHESWNTPIPQLLLSGGVLVAAVFGIMAVAR